MANQACYENHHLNLEATELRLGLPGTGESEKEPYFPAVRVNKRDSSDLCNISDGRDSVPPAKAQVVGWPPVRSYRKNALKRNDPESAGKYVKVSMDGAPYLRKVDLMVYKGYGELLKGLQVVFECDIGAFSKREGYDGSGHAPTYEDKDGDWMLVGDVPWEMFLSSCKRLRIMKGSEAKGLSCA